MTAAGTTLVKCEFLNLDESGERSLPGGVVVGSHLVCNVVAAVVAVLVVLVRSAYECAVKDEGVVAAAVVCIPPALPCSRTGGRSVMRPLRTIAAKANDETLILWIAAFQIIHLEEKFSI